MIEKEEDNSPVTMQPRPEPVLEGEVMEVVSSESIVCVFQV